MNNESKNIDIELKDDSGQVEAVFSIFNSLDSDGDVVMPELSNLVLKITKSQWYGLTNGICRLVKGL